MCMIGSVFVLVMRMVGYVFIVSCICFWTCLYSDIYIYKSDYICVYVIRYLFDKLCVYLADQVSVTTYSACYQIYICFTCGEVYVSYTMFVTGCICMCIYIYVYIFVCVYVMCYAFSLYRPLVDLIRSSRNTTVQLKAASAVEALANNNPDSQRVFLESNLDAPKSLIRLLKVSVTFERIYIYICFRFVSCGCL